MRYKKPIKTVFYKLFILLPIPNRVLETMQQINSLFNLILFNCIIYFQL